MSAQTSKVLSDNLDTAKRQFKTLLKKEGWGIVVVIRDDSNMAFNMAAKVVKGLDANIMAVWSKNPEAVQSEITQLPVLPGVGPVDFSQAGHRLVSININRALCSTLNKADSVDSILLLGAVICTST